MQRQHARPTSPHWTIWRWGPHMMVSILHRLSGVGLSIVGGLVLTWWLVAAASGAEAYGSFGEHAVKWYGVIVGVGLSWALIFHTIAGLRHLVMDIGAGFELRTNKRWAHIVIVLPVLLTALLWVYILEVR